MKSIRIEKPGKACVYEQDIPVPGPGEALLKMVVGGVCGSDLSSYRGVSAYTTFPRVVGHEFAAEVIEAPENEYGIKKGMLVTGNPYFNCGACYACRRGYFTACINNQTMGVKREGAFSEYFVMPVKRLFDTSGLDPETVALIEPFCISYHAMKRAAIHPGDKALIFGAGAIGILAGAAAEHFGAKVHICDIAPDKVSFSVESFGFDGGFVNDSEEALDKYIREVTHGDGFDITVEAVGAPSTFVGCSKATACRGQLIQVGVAKHNADYNFLDIQTKEMTILGSKAATNDDFKEVIRLVRDGAVNLKKLISRTYTPEQTAEAFAEMDKESDYIVKAIFDFRK